MVTIPLKETHNRITGNSKARLQGNFVEELFTYDTLHPVQLENKHVALLITGTNQRRFPKVP